MRNEETLEWAIGCKDKQILELWQQIERLEEKLAHYRWRPISEIHEDYGECVLMHIEDPGRLEIGNNCSHGFIADDWTHFAEVPKLTNEEAERWRAAMEPKR